MKVQQVAVWAIAAACAVSGCASVHKAGQDADARAKRFAPVPDKAVVYIYRNEILGTAIKLPVLVDGIAVGDTGPNSFLEVAVLGGNHIITSKGETDSTLSLATTAGQVYYVWQEVKVGMWAASSLLHRVDETKGQKGVRESKLLVTEAPALRAPDDAMVAPASVAPAHADAVAARVTAPQRGAVPSSASMAAPAAPVKAEYGLAALDNRIGKPMFEAAQDVASAHQCERMLRVRSVDGDNAHFFSRCDSGGAPIEILCNATSCHEGPPQG
ncbi:MULTISPECIES: DUF2846 domain-containing protein [unclassified Luteibacter]|uniref:DUF2846 domain-containing protein n=1 Tax=Luteibacter sp. PvP019 TaxID=3156436 RepID=UPI003391CD31